MLQNSHCKAGIAEDAPAFNPAAASTVPEEYTHGQVDEPALVPIDGAVKVGLEKALKRRPTETELVEVRLALNHVET